MIDVKEQIWLTNVEFLWLIFNTSWTLVFCTDIYECTVLKVIGQSDENEICLPKEECISGHR